MSLNYRVICMSIMNNARHKCTLTISCKIIKFQFLLDSLHKSYTCISTLLFFSYFSRHILKLYSFLYNYAVFFKFQNEFMKTEIK